MAAVTASKHGPTGGDDRDHAGTAASVVVDTSARSDADEPTLKTRKSRKRTKTGCLTCRRRRIKCGEERPICSNCTKSRRHCEGYNPRVVFKTPNIDFHHFQNGAASITFPPGTLGLDLDIFSHAHQSTPIPPGANSNTGYTQLRPRPVNLPTAYPGIPTIHRFQHPATLPQTESYVPLTQLPMGSNAPSDLNPQQYNPFPGQISLSSSASHHGSHFENATTSDDCNNPIVNRSQLATAGSAWPTAVWEPPHAANADVARTQRPFAHRAQDLVPAAQPEQVYNEPSTGAGYAPRPALVRPIDPRQPLTYPMSGPFVPSTPRDSFASAYHAKQAITAPEDTAPAAPYKIFQMSPERLLDEAAVEHHDDDYFDVESHEEMDLETSVYGNDIESEHRTLSTLMSMVYLEGQGRPFGTQVYDGQLDSYRPERVANPLRNPFTARVFAHFIQRSSLAMTVFTRRPIWSHKTADTTSIPFSEQSLLALAMPMAALHHQGLLHAILAMSSFQMAKVTQSSVTPSMKHYAYALKRIHHAVGDPIKRRSVPVLAASLLLAMYELWSGEHIKWNSHLLGARQLLIEIQFAAMYREFRRIKADQYQLKAQQRMYGITDAFAASKDHIWNQLDQVPDIDSSIVSMLSGRHVDYDNFGQVVDDHDIDPELLPDLDIPKFEQQKDLFWWFAKQDVVNSIVSGNALLLPFNRWVDCPPRAPLGDLNAVYGSYDHLLLLMARIADFQVRDRKRKLKKIEANGGQWRPTRGIQLGPPSHIDHPVANSSANIGPSGSRPSSLPQGRNPSELPTFFGMSPLPYGGGSMPRPYSSGVSNSTDDRESDSHQSNDLETATAHAKEEWAQIRAALQAFESLLPNDHQPLSSGQDQPIQTPFGPALIYRKHDIGCLWAYYNLALLVAYRSHPDMPPHAHQAAGVAAFQTKEIANNIGRISAAFIAPPPNEVLTPILASAMSECMPPMFFAAVQYQDPAQRAWTISRLLDLETRCGNVTAGIVAKGIETAWHKAYVAKRGPPYVRKHDHQAEDERLNGKWQHADPNEPVKLSVKDRRFVRTQPATKLYWAMGILAMEDDD